MSKDKLLPIAIFSLAISIIIAASIISKGIENKGRYIGDGVFQGFNNVSNTIRDINLNNEEDDKGVFSSEECSEYLGISEERLMQIMNNQESKIPYVKVGENFIFSKNALDKWIEESNFKM
ncbi:helix-turn-helix domain-containing protein [Clostridium sp. AL.422]|uniref:helix-turn-helix domain-containing protein n=1 Tax=Clostridium TaxID=1485 RepID=UPI00293DA582|nr:MULTISPECIES: helix-turn-helix domain-containing protein [unclassified Clostridium]MDV4149558.1 helix-turn-helix domain-containing protein [Clostridium sp. AL.422]